MDIDLTSDDDEVKEIPLIDLTDVIDLTQIKEERCDTSEIFEIDASAKINTLNGFDVSSSSLFSRHAEHISIKMFHGFFNHIGYNFRFSLQRHNAGERNRNIPTVCKEILLHHRVSVSRERMKTIWTALTEYRGIPYTHGKYMSCHKYNAA